MKKSSPRSWKKRAPSWRLGRERSRHHSEEGKQVLRSGTSVGANYREAYRARSKAEFIAKCGDSLREIEETGYWLELLCEANIVPAAKLSSLRQDCDELTAIFVTIIKRSRANAQ